ncbi:MAG: HAD-IIIA family hydrolase [Eubacteriales bacterium]|nr:HAD-IIIA family hydrolase [Eubacteriales bacterium]
MRIKNFCSHYHTSDLREIDWAGLYNSGYRVILVDIDNTLAKHGAESPDSYAKATIESIQAAGLRAVVLSNAAGDRAERYAEKLGIDGLGQAHKPSPRKILAKLSELNCPQSKAMMIGDQILTDVWAARKAGITSVKVEPRFKEEIITVRLKRYLEYLLKAFIDLGQDLPRKASAEQK